MTDEKKRTGLTEEERTGIEKARPLVELGYHGVPTRDFLERMDQGERLAREAITGLMEARMKLHIVIGLGKGKPVRKPAKSKFLWADERERLLMELLEIEGTFGGWYKELFGREFEPIMPPSPHPTEGRWQRTEMRLDGKDLHIKEADGKETTLTVKGGKVVEKGA